MGIAGQGVQKDDSDTGYGKYRVADNGQHLVAVIRAPTVLGQQAYDNTHQCGHPNDDFQCGGNLHFRECIFPNIHQQNVKNGHRDRGNLQPHTQLLFYFVAAATECTNHTGDQVECIAAA